MYIKFPDFTKIFNLSCPCAQPFNHPIKFFPLSSYQEEYAVDVNCQFFHFNFTKILNLSCLWAHPSNHIINRTFYIRLSRISICSGCELYSFPFNFTKVFKMYTTNLNAINKLSTEWLFTYIRNLIQVQQDCRQ